MKYIELCFHEGDVVERVWFDSREDAVAHMHASFERKRASLGIHEGDGCSIDGYEYYSEEFDAWCNIEEFDRFCEIVFDGSAEWERWDWFVIGEDDEPLHLDD